MENVKSQASQQKTLLDQYSKYVAAAIRVAWQGLPSLVNQVEITGGIINRVGVKRKLGES